MSQSAADEGRNPRADANPKAQGEEVLYSSEDLWRVVVEFSAKLKNWKTCSDQGDSYQHFWCFSNYFGCHIIPEDPRYFSSTENREIPLKLLKICFEYLKLSMFYKYRSFLLFLSPQWRQAGRRLAGDRARAQAGAGEAGQDVRRRRRCRHDRLPVLQVRGAQAGTDQLEQQLS